MNPTQPLPTLWWLTRITWALLLSVVAAPANLPAQAIIAGPTAATVLLPRAHTVSAPHPSPLDRRSPGFLGDGSRDHRYTGFWVGALTIAIPGTAYFLACGGSTSEFCDRGRLAWRVPLASAVTGLVGALIGASMSK